MSFTLWFLCGLSVGLLGQLLWAYNVYGFRDSLRHAAWYSSSWIMHRCINPIFLHGQPYAWLAPFPPIAEVFPQHKDFEAEWQTIRDEVLRLVQTPLLQPVEATSPAFFKWLTTYMANQTAMSGKPLAEGGQWKSVLLRCYGQDMPESMAMCPTLTRLMDKHKTVVKLVMVSVLEPHSVIPAHRGPLAAVLRYHLPLVVPGFSLDGKQQAGQQPNKCKITVGEQMTHHVGIDADGFLPGTEAQREWLTRDHSWVPGEGVLFSDVYLHSVNNDTDERRIVLFLDILRNIPPSWTWSMGSVLSQFLDSIGFHKMVFLFNGMQERTVQH